MLFHTVIILEQMLSEMLMCGTLFKIFLTRKSANIGSEKLMYCIVNLKALFHLLLEHLTSVTLVLCIFQLLILILVFLII